MTEADHPSDDTAAARARRMPPPPLPLCEAVDRERAIALARDEPPTNRCRILAMVARWTLDAEVEPLAHEAVVAARSCEYVHGRACALAWPIAALTERGRQAAAMAILEEARYLARWVTPNSARTTTLSWLLRGAWGLGSAVRRSIVEEIAEIQREDSFWRISMECVDVAYLMLADDADLARRLVAELRDERWRRKGEAVLRKEPRRPRSFFPIC